MPSLAKLAQALAPQFPAPGLDGLTSAARELTDALLVNPYDRSAVALSLRQALAMPLAERRSRHEAMLKVVCANSITHWHTSFIARLQGE